MKDTVLNDLSNQIEGLKVLFVDDAPDVLGLLTFVLRQSGARVRSASSVMEALSVLSEFMPDVIVSDIRLPDGDGDLLAAQVTYYLAEGGCHPVPMVALSG